MRITHHFGPQRAAGAELFCTYIKETKFGAGESIPMHEHVQAHHSVLAEGWVRLTIDGEGREIKAPQVLLIEAGKRHEVKALTAVTWLCVWASNEADPNKVDETLIS